VCKKRGIGEGTGKSKKMKKIKTSGKSTKPGGGGKEEARGESVRPQRSGGKKNLDKEKNGGERKVKSLRKLTQNRSAVGKVKKVRRVRSKGGERDVKLS